MDVKQNILGAIGRTPMVRINSLWSSPCVNIFAKLEGFNPTGSIKDRIAVKMIEAAEREGRLMPGKTIIEPTSGNTGIGLAIVGIVKGYPVEIVMSEAVSVERRKIIRAYGGKVRLTPAAEGTDGAIRLARRLVAENPDKYAFDHMEVEELARKGGYVTYQGKQCTEYAVANSAARVCAAVLHNEHAVLSASTLMTGQYGEEGIFTSLPCVIGAEGVEEVYTLDLSEYELEGFHKSCQHIRDNIAQLDWWDAEAYDAK